MSDQRVLVIQSASLLAEQGERRSVVLTPEELDDLLAVIDLLNDGAPISGADSG